MYYLIWIFFDKWWNHFHINCAVKQVIVFYIDWMCVSLFSKLTIWLIFCMSFCNFIYFYTSYFIWFYSCCSETWNVYLLPPLNVNYTVTLKLLICTTSTFSDVLISLSLSGKLQCCITLIYRFNQGQKRSSQGIF